MSLLLFACLCGTARSQIVSGTIVGTTADATGAVVAGARITAANESTGVARSTMTDSSGGYVFPQLPPGNYKISVSAQGFRTYEVSHVVLLVDQTVRVDARLELGEVSERVEVSAQAAQVDSETSTLGQVIESRRIVDLPLNGRNFMQLATISSGVAPAYNARSATITNQTGRTDLAVHVSGGRGDSNSYLIDGVESRSTWFNSPSVLLSVDAIQEFKIERNMFSAEYGQGGGIVSLVSKSGSNDIHGSAYEFLRNNHFDAKNFFDNYFGQKQVPFKQNQFGLTAGGPIRKNKLFFFGDFEKLRSRQNNTLSANVPTPAQLAGNLNGLTSTRPGGVILDPLAGLPFPDNVIPADRISSVTKNFIQYTPVPNLAGSKGTNYVVGKSTNRDDDQYGIRVDYQISSADTLFGRYTDFASSLYKPGIGVLAGNLYPYAGRNTVVQETHVFSPRLLNVFKFGYNWANVFNTWEPASTSLADAIGLKINQVPAEYGLPGVTVSGGYYVGGGTGINQGGVDNLAQFSDTLSWVRNRHNLSFGADIRIIHFDERLGLNNNGAFTFTGQYTGSPVADFLLGDLASASAQIGLGEGLWRSKSLNFFVEDDWKVTDRLTLNLGLRYEYDQPFYDPRHHEGYFDTSLDKFVVGISQAESPIKRQIPQVLYDPNLRQGIWFPDRNNFAPRFGFAYRFGASTVLRGGYGIFYSKTQGNELQFKVNAPPLVFSASLTGNPATPNFNWDRDAFPDPASPAFPVGTLAPFSIDPRDRTPYLQQWNLGTERTLTRTLVLEVSYAGMKGTKLAERVNINQAQLPNPSSITPINSRRPFPDFGDILSSNFQENSIYNALQARLEKRFSGGLNFLAAYTWGHSIDTASRGSGGSWHQDAYHLRADRGSSDFDVRHRFTGSVVYELPFGRGRKYLSNAGALANGFAGGWSVNTIVTFMTGNYFSVTVPGDRANVGGYPFQRADIAVPGCDGNLSHGDRTINRYFNTGCFVTTPIGTFGNSGRNIVEIPGLNNWDTSFVKQIPIQERIQAQFRAEFFNLFNHSQFGQPDLTVGDVLFGAIRTARDPRIVQLALKVLW
ncbi:MAG TPA: TonB-dependent receptor [Bryobacteraceae bacterium]|nr:TonB-dependent receptor [Bryobacteraceae bacterium]